MMPSCGIKDSMRLCGGGRTCAVVSDFDLHKLRTDGSFLF
jgi:hypothetical protein